MSMPARLERSWPDHVELQPEEAAFFEENGFFGPFKVYEPDEATEIWRAMRTKVPDTSRQIFQGTKINYDRHFDISELTRHVANARIVGKLRGLIGEDILCWRTEFFSKFPGEGGTEWHQVEEYSYASGTAALVPTHRREKTPMELTVWTAFTEADAENGCLKLMPGSHKVWYFDERRGLSEAADERNGRKTEFFGYHYAELKVDPNWEPDESKAVYVECKPGEAVVFTARCMHGSLPNSSRKRMRLGVASRYVPTDVRVYPDPSDLSRFQASFAEHGVNFDLTKHGCILVSGTDRYRHNRMRTHNELGEPFGVEVSL